MTTWRAAHSILYLMTEADENLLDQTGDLILLDREVTGAVPCGTYDMEDEDGSNL